MVIAGTQARAVERRADILAAACELLARGGTAAVTHRQVAEKVLGQIESSALFTEESCSFSQGDMFDALTDWLGHARRLAAG